MVKHAGFTLIELMITVAIVAIIAAIAIPSYDNYVRETRRADAQISLVRAAQKQEQYHSINSGYATTLADLGLSTDSAEGFYALTLTNTGCNSGYVGCFQITATATGAQSSDSSCATLSLDQSGTRSSTGGADDCWP